ncbi:MAG TPA: hypothetical protein VF768_07080 [Holophagaceae bacterium]
MDDLPLDPAGSSAGSESSFLIPLAEVPEPRRTPVRAPVHQPVERFVTPEPEPEMPPERPSRLAPIKTLVRQFYFDPAHAFHDGVDWPRFARTQTSLFLLSLVIPFLALLFLGFILGVLYLTGASLYDATSPNPIYELMLYPTVFVLARGYWVIYLLLPAGLFLMGWLWAAATAWVLSKMEGGACIDFKRAFATLAMFGAMLAPFTTFPFLRLVALAVILILIARRMEDTFGIGFWSLVGRAGLIFLVAASLYGALERKVETDFPGGEELQTNLAAFVRQHKRLTWPTFHHKLYVSPNERLYADLSDFSPEIREPAVKRALGILQSGTETPTFRFQLAQCMATHGEEEAYLFMSRFNAAGQGTPANPAEALAWMQKYTAAFPKDLDAGLEQAQMYFTTNHPLDGKRWLVKLGKRNLPNLDRITSFIDKRGLGKNDPRFNGDIQLLYRLGNTTHYVSNYNKYATRSSYGYQAVPETAQQALLRKLDDADHDSDLWFYRAMALEYGTDTPASLDAYGEAAAALDASALAQKAQGGDPVAMDILADRSLQSGDVATARKYWIAATQALNSDNRYGNAAYYMKLADSYDPGTSQTATDPHQAIKYYLAAVLTSTWYGHNSPVSSRPLQRLLGQPVPDPMGQPFLDLCLKHDIPEAWAMMGSRYLNGDFPGVSKNLSKSLECFRKARTLGFQGPQFAQQLTLMETQAHGAGTAKS